MLSAAESSKTTFQSQISEPKSVTVEQRGGGWFVVIVEDGKRYEEVFQLEAYASSWADGQRMRLGIYR